MHKVINRIEVLGTIAFKSKQVYGFADDIVLVGRNISALKEMFSILELEERHWLKSERN